MPAQPWRQGSGCQWSREVGTRGVCSSRPAAHVPSVAGDSGDQSARVSGFADRASASEYRSKFVRTQDFTRVRVLLGSHRGGEQGVCGLQATAGVRVLMVAHGIYGEGNGNPLQHSCLENPMDEGAW